jgi:hypothetical protein
MAYDVLAHGRCARGLGGVVGRKGAEVELWVATVTAGAAGCPGDESVEIGSDARASWSIEKARLICGRGACAADDALARWAWE